MKNVELSQKILKSLFDLGVNEVCLCAGARNSPFVFALQNSSGLKVHSFFEERSAAFFALGRIQESARPVAVITTSGTAVAELLPAAIEANYTGAPLILLTADRPSSYREKGAPQSIEQVGIFSSYVEKCVDVEGNWKENSLSDWSLIKPLQINVCFAEPLIENDIEKLILHRPPDSQYVKPSKCSYQNELRTWITELNKYSRPLILLGGMSKSQSAKVLPFVKAIGAPVYAEGLSHLRASMALEGQELRSGDEIVKWGLEKQLFDVVLRIGGVPTLRAWRDLEDKFKSLPVLSLSDLPYSGLSRESHHCQGLSQLHPEHFRTVSRCKEIFAELFSMDKERSKSLRELLRKYPNSEPSLLAALSWKIKGQSVYLGNSLPVRNWDWVSTREAAPFRIFGNRGANGIDGQLSTFLGFANEFSDNWAIVGDLTAMYDLVAPWAVKDELPGPLRIVVMNNSGGQIFNRIFKNDMFLNRHSIEFASWAAMWGWEYQKWQKIPDKLQLSPRTMIELIPDANQTQLFQDDWELVCRRT